MTNRTIHGDRLRVLLLNARRVAKRKYSKQPLWVLVSDLTGYGSSSSAEICVQSGLDPHGVCGVRIAKQLPENEKTP